MDEPAQPPKQPKYSVVEKSGSMLLVEAQGEMALGAAVIGPLRVNRAGCFEVGDMLLVVAGDGQIVDGGQGIRVKGAGSWKVGEEVDGSGGYFTVDELHEERAWQDCAAGSKGDEYVLLTP